MGSSDEISRRAGRAADRAEGAAGDLADNPWFERAARAGFVMSGAVHLIIGWTAVRIAMGAGGSADQSGALQAFTSIPGGRILLAVGALMMLALAIWFLLDAWFGVKRTQETKEKATHAIKSVGKAGVYLALGFTAARFVVGSGSDSGEQSASMTAQVMQLPAGRAAIVGLGLAVIGIGIYHVYKGATQKFEEDISGHRAENVDTTVTVTGTVGYVAKGIALVAVGVLFGWAAIGSDPEKATGMDGALTEMASLPAGTILLIAVGVGLAVFGVFSILKARYVDL